MRTRVITAIFIILITAPLCLFSHTVAWPIFVAAMCVMAVFEMLGCVGTRRKLAVAVPALLMAAVFPFALRYCATAYEILLIFMIAMFVYLIYLFALSVFSRKTGSGGRVRDLRHGVLHTGVLWCACDAP